jgi:hypothetical protein
VSAGSAIESLLDKIDGDLSDFLVFAGILDNNAKLLSYRVGKSSFSLPIERHDTLDVQIALMFSLIKQLEDISGPHKLSVTRFSKHDIFMFGSQDLHIFVITSPTSEERVAKTLVELVGTMSGPTPVENLVTKTSSAPVTRRQEHAVTTTLTAPAQPRADPAPVDRHVQMHRPRPEAITVLQGYLMGLEAGCTIEDDIEGRYKIKATEDDSRLSWPLLERISTVFSDRITIHHIGKDADGKVFVRISTK